MAVKCDMCGRERRPDETKEYNAADLLLDREHLGWYSGSDGEICPESMIELFEISNG